MKQEKIKIKNNKITLRLLRSEDKKMLSDFFKCLSEKTKKWYSPHDFNNKIAKEICNEKNKFYRRVISICDNKIISYCILYFGIREWEEYRYNTRYNYDLKSNETCTIAPCVSDPYQGIGIGNEMMKYVIQVAKQNNKKIIVLWGGVVVKNKRAVNYYKKNNFKISKKWLHPIKKVMSYDMYLRI